MIWKHASPEENNKWGDIHKWNGNGGLIYLNNYFDFHVRLSIRSSVRSCVRRLNQFPAVVPQNVTNKSCLECIKSEKYASWVTLSPQSDRYCRGEAEVRIINFKTTWSEFQLPSQTAPAEAKLRYVYSILKPHGQSSKSTVRLLPCEAKPSYVYTILKKYHLPRVGPKQLCALAHLGSTRAAGTS